MKRSYLILGFVIWSLSLAAAYFTGRALKPDESSHPATAPHPTPSRSDSDENRVVPQIESASEASAVMASYLAGENELSLATALAQVPGLSADEARGFLAEAFARPKSDPQRSGLIHALLRQLAETAPQEALELAGQIGSLRDTERVKTAILEVWAGSDPIAALAWARTALANEPMNLRGSQMRAIFRGYAQTNPQAAFQSAQAMDQSTQAATRLRAMLMEEVIQTQVRSGDLADAKLAIEQLGDGETKSDLLGEFVNEWASFDPVNAAAYVESLGDAATTRIKTTLVGEWAKNDPAAAAAWLGQLSEDDPAIARAASEIIREWTRYDLNASAEWLNSLPASPELDRAVASYTYRAAQEDPATAMSWAESISNDWMRTRLMQNVAGSWKSDDPESFEQYLESSGLDAEQQEKLRNAQTGNRGDRRFFGPPPAL